MGEDVQDKDSARAVVDPRDQAVLVPFDVKNRSSADSVRVIKVTPDVVKVLPFSMLRDSEPVHQGNSRIGVLFGEVENRRPADYPHENSLHNVNYRVKDSNHPECFPSYFHDNLRLGPQADAPK